MDVEEVIFLWIKSPRVLFMNSSVEKYPPGRGGIGPIWCGIGGGRSPQGYPQYGTVCVGSGTSSCLLCPSPILVWSLKRNKFSTLTQFLCQYWGIVCNFSLLPWPVTVIWIILHVIWCSAPAWARMEGLSTYPHSHLQICLRTGGDYSCARPCGVPALCNWINCTMGFPWGYPPPLSYHIEGMLVPVSATILYHYPYLRSYLWWHRSLTGSYSIPWVGTDMITMYLLSHL